MRGKLSRFAPDEGMTLVEVVVAAAILFFVMTAILGLVGRTTMLTVQARQMNSINNAVNSYVEWARNLPFEDVEVAPTGSLDTTVVVTGDFTVQIVPSVQPHDTNSFLKNVWLGITATRSDGTMRVVNTMVVIHDRDQYMTEGSQTPATDPTIFFMAPSPPDGTAVWSDTSGSYWKDATGVTRPLQICVRAEAIGERTVDEVYAQGEQTWDLEDVFGNFAHWFAPTWTESPVFAWDLKQTTELSEALVQEGTRSVYAYVKDSAGVIRYDMRQYCVDNKPPVAIPSPLTHDGGVGSMCGTLEWPTVMDGTSPAFAYAVDVRRQLATPTTAYSQWAIGGNYSGANTSFAVNSLPMSRLGARVRAYSPRGLTTTWSGWIHFVTRPKITGTFTVVRRATTPKSWTVNTSLAATPPSFESTGTTYAWYEGTTLLATTTTSTFAAPAVVAAGDPSIVPFPARTYSVVVTTKPLGLPSGEANAEVTVTSNAVATAAGASGTYTLPAGVW